MQCAKCETKLGPDDRFCTDCGMAAPREGSPSSQRPAAKPIVRNNSTRNAILILGIAFCAFGATGYWAYVQYSAPLPVATYTETDALPPEAPLEIPREPEQAEVVELSTPPDLALDPPPVEPAPIDPSSIRGAAIEPAPDPIRVSPPAEPKSEGPVAKPPPPPASEPLPAAPAAAPPAALEPSVEAEPTPTEPEAPSRPPRGRPSILMPGAGAYSGSASPPPGTARSKDPGAPVPLVARFPERPVAPPQARTEGNVYWTGRLRKGETIVVAENIAAAGFVDGDYFPGQPIEVLVPSPAVRIVERPGPENGWTKLVLECLRSTKRKATINVQWRLAGR